MYCYEVSSMTIYGKLMTAILLIVACFALNITFILFTGNMILDYKNVEIKSYELTSKWKLLQNTSTGLLYAPESISNLQTDFSNTISDFDEYFNNFIKTINSKSFIDKKVKENIGSVMDTWNEMKLNIGTEQKILDNINILLAENKLNNLNTSIIEFLPQLQSLSNNKIMSSYVNNINKMQSLIGVVDYSSGLIYKAFTDTYDQIHKSSVSFTTVIVTASVSFTIAVIIFALIFVSFFSQSLSKKVIKIENIIT